MWHVLAGFRAERGRYDELGRGWSPARETAGAMPDDEDRDLLLSDLATI